MLIKIKFAAYIRLTAYVIAITWAITFAFIRFEASPDGLISSLFVLSVGSYYGLAVLLSAIVLLPIFLIPKIRMLVPILIFSWWCFLLVDYLVFSVYKFHVDALLLEMFFFDFSGMGIPSFLLAAFFLVALLLLTFTIFLQSVSFKGGRTSIIVSALVVAAVVPIFLVNSIVSIWAHRYDRSEVTQYAAVLPAFFPVTSHKDGHRISALFPELMPAEQGQQSSQFAAKAQGLINYPLSSIECSNDRPESILMIVLESWQADMLNPNTMPITSSFSQHAFQFNQHISSGSTTIPGFFGLMFGLHPSYYSAFAASATKHPSEFTKTLGLQDYLMRVFTTGSLERFAIRTLLFPNIAQRNYRKYQDDRDTVQAYVDDLSDRERVNKPTFDFLYLTSSHSPYRYPAEFEKFQPTPELVGSFVFDRMADGGPLKNRARNSVYYLDSLIGQIIDELKNQDALDNTWVVITGDHAEEFNEAQLGYWGHGSNFSRWQTHVPLVVHRPSGGSAVIESTSVHQDIVPTLLTEAVGCDTPTHHYSNGLSLFNLPEKRSTVIASYSFSAYWVDGIIYERESGKKYSWRDINERAPGLNTQAIRKLWGEENQFRQTSVPPKP